MGFETLRATLKSMIYLPENILFQDVGGEAVLLNRLTGRYYGLDEVATQMWISLTEHAQVGMAYRDLLAQYDVTEERLEQDLLAFVNELVSNGLLQVSWT
jgi:ornithine carbamoyltransferase